LLAAMPHAARSGAAPAIGALLLIGLDHFCEAANTLGPRAARAVIVECAARLKALCTPDTDGNAPIVGRVSHETFAIASA
ncbi:hypothetical protein ABTD98_22630, partial [Acinetobacter baumannii]